MAIIPVLLRPKRGDDHSVDFVAGKRLLITVRTNGDKNYTALKLI